MMHGLYFSLLVFAIACLGLIDMKYKLVLFRDRNLAYKVIMISLALFIAWDIAGIVLDIFYIGKTNVLLGLQVGEFPIEELFFLVLLNYTALIISQFMKVKQGLK